MNGQECQTDLEVILDFLEEHYRQESGRKDQWDNMRDLYSVSSNEVQDFLDGERFLCALKQEEAEQQVMESPISDPDGEVHSDAAAEDPAAGLCGSSDRNDLNKLCSHLSPAEKSPESLPGITPAEKVLLAGRKLRLFHFLFEMLQDPGMTDCLAWVPASVGVFRFSARHKERVAELWGRRKGNKMPMTYQKMSRALRNYARSGEIIKVKKKLTYQFSVATLSTLQSQHGIVKAPCGSSD